MNLYFGQTLVQIFEPFRTTPTIPGKFTNSKTHNCIQPHSIMVAKIKVRIQINEGQNAVLFHPFDRRISLLRKVFSRPNLGRMVLEWQFLEINEDQFFFVKYVHSFA